MKSKTSIAWQSSFSIDIPKIDEQHKKWLDIYNNLNESIIQGLGKLFVENALKDFFEYTQYHFDEEEKLFVKHNYPKSEAHVLLHRNIIWTITHLSFDLAKGKNDTLLAIDTLAVLKKWLTGHILSADKEFGDYVKCSKTKITSAKKTREIS